MRKLVTLRIIDKIEPIPGADAIEVVTVGGWKVVTKKDEYHIGEQCVYFEIDSFLKDGDPRWQFLVDKSSRNYNGVKGHVLKTVKLRGQISQGLILKFKLFPEIMRNIPVSGWNPLAFSEEEYARHIEEDRIRLYETDFTSIVGIEKYESPVAPELAGQVRGSFPSFIKRTDQERAQNIGKDIFQENANSKYEVSTKLDGTSFTAFYVDGELGVCSRNLELKINEDNSGNTLVRMFIDSKMQQVLQEYRGNIALQGELCGPGIQKNREGLRVPKLFLFDIYDIDSSCYFPPKERMEILKKLYSLGLDVEYVSHVPVIYNDVTLTELGVNGMDALILYADGPSLVNPVREGLVFKRVDGQFSFKIISNKFLMKVDS